MANNLSERDRKHWLEIAKEVNRGGVKHTSAKKRVKSAARISGTGQTATATTATELEVGRMARLRNGRRTRGKRRP